MDQTRHKTALIRKRMEAAAISQVDVECVSGIRQPNVSMILSGRAYVSPAKLQRIEDAVERLETIDEPTRHELRRAMRRSRKASPVVAPAVTAEPEKPKPVMRITRL